MKLIILVIGTGFVLLVSLFSFIATSFAIFESASDTYRRYWDVAIVAVPALSALTLIIPWYGYFNDWSKMTLFWFASPVLIVCIHFSVILYLHR